LSSISKNITVLIGTYTEHEGSPSRGIYMYDLDPSSGELNRERTVEGVRNPSYLEVHPQRGFFYAVNEVEVFAGAEGGGVSAFAMDSESGGTTLLNVRSSEGKSPCYISIDHSGRFALVANYGGGNAAMLPIQADGRLGPASDVVQHTGSSVDPLRQTGPFMHCIRPDPANKFAIAADLGTDTLAIYRMDLEHGRLEKHADVHVQPGSGPRHLIFHPHQKYLYLINELSSTLIVYRYDAEAGRLEEVQTVSTLPPGFEGENLCADLHSSGPYVYASNRKHDTIAWYRIDESSGRLSYRGEAPSGGKNPRGFAIDPSGSFLLAANEESDNVVVFQIEQATGQPRATGFTIQVPRPVCVKFLA
jgi:6-phosphogluconolactonase